MILAIKILQETVLGDSVIEWLSLAALIGGFSTFYHHIECHYAGCHRLGKFSHGHYKLCHVHHPLVPDDGKINQIHIDEVTKKLP